MAFHPCRRVYTTYHYWQRFRKFMYILWSATSRPSSLNVRMHLFQCVFYSMCDFDAQWLITLTHFCVLFCRLLTTTVHHEKFIVQFWQGNTTELRVNNHNFIGLDAQITNSSSTGRQVADRFNIVVVINAINPEIFHCYRLTHNRFSGGRCVGQTVELAVLGGSDYN